MTLRVLIISDRREFRQSVGHHVMLEWNSAHAAEYEPALRGRLRPGFTGSGVRRRIARSRSAGWARSRVARGPGGKAVVPADSSISQPPASGPLVRNALTAGAAHVLARTDFEHPQLIEALHDALARRSNLLAETSRVAREPQPEIALARSASVVIAASSGSRSADRRACSWPSMSAAARGSCSRSSARCPTSSKAIRRSSASCASTSSSRT
jgi:hypothetical protein